MAFVDYKPEHAADYRLGSHLGTSEGLFQEIVRRVKEMKQAREENRLRELPAVRVISVK